MSWATDRATIKAAINGLSGYIIIPENKDPEEAPGTHSHKAYSIGLVGIADPTMYAGGNVTYSHTVEVLVKYLGVDDTIQATNESLFLTLQNTISALTGFKGFNSDPALEPMDNKHLLGTVDFEFGIDCNS